MPFAIVPLVMFTADRRKMGELVAPRWVTVLAATDRSRPHRAERQAALRSRVRRGLTLGIRSSSDPPAAEMASRSCDGCHASVASWAQSTILRGSRAGDRVGGPAWKRPCHLRKFGSCDDRDGMVRVTGLRRSVGLICVCVIMALRRRFGRVGPGLVGIRSRTASPKSSTASCRALDRDQPAEQRRSRGLSQMARRARRDLWPGIHQRHAVQRARRHSAPARSTRASCTAS